MLKRAELEELGNDPQAQAYIKELCKRDFEFFIDHFAWTYDPRAELDDRHRPFILYDFQREELQFAENCYKNKQNLLVEKSRDMGVSWIFAAWIYHKWLFEPGFNALMGSRKEDYVDNKQSDSLFGKLDYLIRYTPEWLLPKGFKQGEKEFRSLLRLTNPELGNTIQGESANSDFSRGGRYSIVFFDEFAFWEWSEQAWAAAGDATKTRIAVSTPNGTNFFKELRFSGKVPVRTIHWKLHPEKDENWYREQCKGRLPEEIAQELDISYERSNKGRVYEEFENVPYGDFGYVHSWPLYVSWDYGLTDDTAIIWWQRDPMSGRRRIIDAYSNSRKLIDFYIPIITGEIPSTGIYSYDYDDIEVIDAHREYKPAIHFGDPSGKQRTQTGGNKSVIDALREYGIHVHTKDDAVKFEVRKTKSKLVMRDLEVNDNPRTRALREAMLNARYPVRKLGASTTNAPIKPIHDWTSHYRSSFEYYCVNERDYHIRKSVDTNRFQNRRDAYSTVIY